MLKLGIIEVGESDYMSPMILVEVAGKEPRPCIDYRKLNGIIRTEYFPLPNIEERVENKLMAELLNGLEDFVVPYLDDIAVFSDTWESHIKHMETVLQRIKRAKLTIKPSKCLTGYYQKYINLFSVIAAPLTDALKGKAKKGEITWTSECENAFRELKGKLIDKPVLYAPNLEREFIVQTDASNAGMGAVLSQLTEQGEEHPILYLIMTDHNPLVWLNRNVSSNPRLMRWALALQPYNFRIVHRSGKSHKNADSLSRSTQRTLLKRVHPFEEVAKGKVGEGNRNGGVECVGGEDVRRGADRGLQKPHFGNCLRCRSFFFVVVMDTARKRSPKYGAEEVPDSFY
ncbi:retrovirus-related Pol polyprotein from transposon 17.6 [Trichonephila clavipes]|uniref:Retrovirus-related Pol polyprotein from transposon 17.6 n=1 Tax=Trichonephila clavipes TaxID=2585209 RepID=A0A8X6SSN8_TRICX|nr:retrovirus-related Pol polyprotein from transposon 17.6 [Trichonephila clavipes]